MFQVYDPFLTPRPGQWSFDQVYNYPNSIQDVLQQVKAKQNVNHYTTAPTPTITKKTSTSKPYKLTTTRTKAEQTYTTTKYITATTSKLVRLHFDMYIDLYLKIHFMQNENDLIKTILLIILPLISRRLLQQNITRTCFKM